MAILVLVAGSVALFAYQVPTGPEFARAEQVVLPQLEVRKPGPPLTAVTTRGAATPVPAAHRPATGGCKVEVRGGKGAQSDIPLVVTVHHGTSGVRLATQSVDIRSLPTSTTITGLESGEHVVYLGRCAECLKHSYLDSTHIKVKPDATTEVALSCESRGLRIRIAAATPPNAANHSPSLGGIPVWLRRPTDPLWRYRKPYATDARESMVFTDEQGRASFADLAPGEYTLHFVGFEPAEAQRARLRFELSAFAQDQPILGRLH